MIDPLLAGLLTGFLHVFQGPDHLAAIAPLAAGPTRSPWREGLRWGFGHSAGVALIGVLLLALRETLPIERFSAAAEFAVGITLVVIGGIALRRALGKNLHAHVHSHDGHEHVHWHVHGQQSSHAPGASGSAHRHRHAALAVGTLHGLAGSSHLFGVLPTLAMPSLSAAAAFLGGFGLGTIVAMMLFAHGVGWVAAITARRGMRPYRAALATLAVTALATGGWWIFQGARS